MSVRFPFVKYILLSSMFYGCVGLLLGNEPRPKNHLRVSFGWANSGCVFDLLHISSQRVSMISLPISSLAVVMY